MALMTRSMIFMVEDIKPLQVQCQGVTVPKVYIKTKKPLPRDIDQIDMVSFDEDVDAVITQLLKDDPRCITISIVGVGGIGKTSLAKLIYDSKAIAEHFPCRTWVSGESERKAVNLSWGQMVNALFVDKKYLIVVDTSYPTQFWSEMGSAYSEISNGTRILFSAPSLDWAPPVTDTNLICKLHQRSDDESWALFKHKLNIIMASKLEANLKEIVLRKCGGLPKVTERKLNGKLKTRRLTEAVRVHWFAKAKEANFLQGQTNITGVIRPLADRVDPNDAIFDHIHGNIPGEDIRKFLDRCITSNCFHFLWVLDLENVYKPKLSKAIGELTRLRSFVGKKMLCSYGGFPKLEVLKFKKVDPLEEWNVEKGALPSLKSLEIDGCRNLMMLPDAGLRHVRTLRDLKVTKLPMLSSRIKDNQGEDWNKIAHGCHVLIED
ncbi:hypothetical protein GH714_006276 [Hevea brasiliensis]|uniref:NB-ARC domain-containing protein n=1 Tax=Hevea brasiliensis TaxID=3981 RepID=A0A6A6NB43_HEVBR|nr:hypothetical protein GH714_006276 [Hevea brasiliensis]